MQVTQGKASPFPEGDVLLDVYEASTDIFALQTSNNSWDSRQPAALVTRGGAAAGSRNQATAVNNASFYVQAGQWQTAASVRVGTNDTRAITQSNQQVGFIQHAWTPWVMGFDPNQIPGLNAACSYHYKMVWESVIRCRDSNGWFFHGWNNGVANTDPYNPVSTTSRAVMLRRVVGGTTFSEIAIRNTAAGSTTIPLATPVECVSAFVNVRWEVTTGPTFRLELFLNDVLAWAGSNATLAWDTTGLANNNFVLQGGMVGIAAPAPAGFEGPYRSRATIYAVR